MFFNDSKRTDKLLEYIFDPKYQKSMWKSGPMGIWQKCPVCHGIPSEKPQITVKIKECRTCEGSGIIHTLSGKPPKK